MASSTKLGPPFWQASLQRDKVRITPENKMQSSKAVRKCTFVNDVRLKS